MWFKHSMSIAKQLIPIYNTTVHKNKSYVALNVAKLFVPYVKDTNMPPGWIKGLEFCLHNLHVAGDKMVEHGCQCRNINAQFISVTAYKNIQSKPLCSYIFLAS